MADYDLAIRGGTLVDGTGAPRRRADVAVRDGRIVAVGEVRGHATEPLDASGAIVTPGFTDLHTHYDGQATWDGELAPSSQHGVTTVVLGSCGVGFAPCRAADRARLIDLMEGVEDIPGTALAEGIAWGWETFPEYMDALDRVPHALDVAVHVVHDPLRVYVMGDRAVAAESATAEDIARMRALTEEGLAAGAVGFSTGRTDNHRAADGSPTPSSEATRAELTGIAHALRAQGGVLQAVSDFDMTESKERFDPEFDLLEAMVQAAGRRPLSVSLLQRQRDSEQWKRVLGRAEEARERGLDIRVQVAARGIGVLLGLDATFHPFIGYPSYQAIHGLPLAERVARMRDPAFKARLLGETTERVAGDGSPIPPLADQLLANIDFVALNLYRLGQHPSYEPDPSEALFGEAMARGVTPLEAIYDALLADDGRELLYFPIYNYMERSLDAVHRMLTHPLALPGLSDGGAHVGTICDGSFPTTMLAHWARDRDPGLPLERVVKMMSHDTSRYLGMGDRGVVAPGQKADLNVIDHPRLRLERPRLVADLPAGGKRFLQAARGYRATVVSGEIILRDDRLTGARPGRLVRAGR
ncbi:MAG: amidohydrolase family protein [Sandaracinaceae bacterium]